MKSYWEYTEKERSEMSEEDVTGKLDIELMQKGVVKVVAPTLKEVKEIKVESKDFFEVDGIIFDSVDSAQKFLALNPSKKNYDYDGAGWDFQYAEPIDAKIVSVRLYPKQVIISLRPELNKNAEAKKWNDNVQKQYDDACKDQSTVLKGVWDDWYECRTKAERYKKIVDTKAEYMKMCNGDERVAESFLVKTFGEESVKEAINWFN
jgi:hypothetical protein